MDFSHEGNPWSYAGGEESVTTGLPIGFSFDDDDDDDIDDEGNDSPHASPRMSCVSSSSFLVCPASPETPWIRSPVRFASPISPISAPLPYDCLASLHFTKGNILSITVTKDLVFTGSSGAKIHAWKLPDCTEAGPTRAPSRETRAMSAHGELLFTVHGDSRVRTWEISPTENCRLKKIMSLPRRRSFFSFPRKNKYNNNKVSVISCLAYNVKEKILFTGSTDQTVGVWKISEKRKVESFIAHEGRVTAILTDQEDGCLFTCSSDGTLKLWRRVYRESSHVLITVLMFGRSPINALALSVYSPSAYILYSGSSDGEVSFWEKENISGRYNHAGILHGHHFAVVCLETVGDLILSGSEDSTIRIWRREDGNSVHSSLAVIDGHHGPVKCLSAVVMENVEGLLVCSASLDQTFKVWRVKVKCDRFRR